jgi:hypothetical protein
VDVRFILIFYLQASLQINYKIYQRRPLIGSLVSFNL